MTKSRYPELPFPAISHCCPRCEREIVPLAMLTALVRRARKDLEGYRLALPDSVAHALRMLDEHLPCHSGLCSPAPREAA